ncbi:MAG TPA: mannosyltransferase [Yeosuana sp.]
MFSIPNLSQDFYRFIWDGRMILEGFNPYLFTPESFIINGITPISQAQELYNGMGILNASHFTNYPPLNQLCFVMAGLFAGKSILGSVIVLRLIIIAADFGTLYFGKKLLKKLNIPVNNLFWFLLNPFIIIELTGNLHFESVMIFFLIWSLYLFQIGKWRYAAFAFACSISIKLIPLIFLPLFFNWFFKGNITTNNWRSYFFELKNLFVFYGLILLISIILFIPFYNADFLSNYAQTVALWFQDFEFNASLYYIARSIGYLFTGYNEIGIIGKIIPVIMILFVFYASFFRNNKTLKELITSMLIVLSFYYFMSTTVHPWYIATLLILSIFTNYKFPLVWSFVAILSYLAYANSDNTENLWIIGLEYSIVYGFLIWEVFIKKAAKLVA